MVARAPAGAATGPAPIVPARPPAAQCETREVNFLVDRVRGASIIAALKSHQVGWRPRGRIGKAERGMANIKSGKKRAQTSAVQRMANRAVKTRIVTLRQQFLEAVAAADKAKSETLFREYCSTLDRAAKHRVIKRNNASRRKSRAARKLAAF
jgi:small subunit ribosomal protein S20